MSTKENQNIEGHLAVSGNVTVGGNTKVRGDAKFSHNLRVEGWLDAPNVKGPSKGVFMSEADLKAAYEKPNAGWWAVVVSGNTGRMYVCIGGEWVQTETTFDNLQIDGGGLEPFIAELRADVAEEAAVRDETDKALQSAIETEASARAAADQAEATARAEAVTAEQTARKAAVQGLDDKITAERNARTAADQDEVAAREAAVTAAKGELNANIRAIRPISTTMQMEGAMLTLKSINADSENIIYCGLRLAEVVNDEVKPVTSAAVKAVTDRYYSSMQRGDELLQTAINEETAAREAAVLAENAARKADVQGLDDKIIFEQDEREAHDAALQTNIDNEAQIRRGDDDVLRGQIVEEAAARKKVDGEIDKRVVKLEQSEILPFNGIYNIADFIADPQSQDAEHAIGNIVFYADLHRFDILVGWDGSTPLFKARSDWQYTRYNQGVNDTASPKPGNYQCSGTIYAAKGKALIRLITEDDQNYIEGRIDEETHYRMEQDSDLERGIAEEAAARESADAEVLRQSEINNVTFTSAFDENPAMTIEQGDTTLEVLMPVADEKKFGLMAPGHVSVLSGVAAFVNMYNMPEWNELYPEQTRIRVVDINGENRQTNILKLLAINKYADQYYGVRINYASADPTLQRVGRDELHRTLPIQSRMRRCVMADNGRVKYYLHPTDSTLKSDGTAANLDGTDGQVMVEIPEFYYKCEEDADGATVLISEYPLPGYHRQRLQYVSAYQATIDRENTSLASVCSMAERYRGGGNNAAWDGTYRTSLGRPVGAVSLTNFRSYARARGAYGLNGAGWNCYTYEANRAIYWLYVIEYANFNSQAAFNAEADSNGFKQGGLGAGVSNINGGKWSAFNNYYPFVPCGITNELGNATGVVAYQMPTEYDPDAAEPLVTEVPSYRGIEHPFGHVFHWMDGALVDVQSDDAGGRSTLYVCLDPAKFSSDSLADYTMVGDVPRDNAWIKRLLMGEHLCNVAAALGGGSTTYYCDFFWGYGIPSTGSQLHGLYVGGRANDGAYDGLATAAANRAPSTANAYIGSRLCFVPA